MDVVLSNLLGITPADLLSKIKTVDGAGSGLHSELSERLANAVTFNSAGIGAASGATFNGDAALTISYNTIGAAASGHNHDTAYLSKTGGTLTGNTIVSGSNVYVQFQSGAYLDMNNHAIVGVDRLTFSDPGNNEGISWTGGSGWGIQESPDSLINGAGNLQILLSGVRHTTYNTNGSVEVLTGPLKVAGNTVWHANNTFSEDEANAFKAGRAAYQTLTFWGNAGGNYLRSLSSTTNAKTIVIDSTTDTVNTAPSAGALGIKFRILGADVGEFNSVGDLVLTNELRLGGTGIFGDAKEIVRYSDGWVRLNPLGQFSSGIYCGSTGTLRHDGTFQIGSTSTAGLYVTLAGTFTYQGNTVWHAGTFDPGTKVNVSQIGAVVDPNTMGGTLSHGIVTTPAGNGPNAYTTIWNLGSNANRDGQFGWYYGSGTPQLWFRSRHDATGNWNPWVSVITSGGGTINGNLTVTGVLIAGDGNGTESVRVGNDASLWDINVAHAIGVKSQSNASLGYVRFGGDSNLLGYDGTSLRYDGSLNFGSVATRQMLNLWSTTYGIGIQNNIMYFRGGGPADSTGGYAWYRGGVHSATSWDGGAGGTLLSRLDNTGTMSLTGGLGVGGMAVGAGTSIMALHSGALGAQTGHVAMMQSGVRLWQQGIETDRKFQLWSYTDAGAYQGNPVSIYRDAQPLIGGSTGWSINGGMIYHGGNRPALGTVAYTISDWNNAADNGWYMASGAANSPGGTGWYIAIVTQHNPNWITQEAWDFTAGASPIRYRRAKLNGTWSAWTSDVNFGYVGGSRFAAGWDSGVAGSFSCNNWFRSEGSSGIFFATYGGGVHMTDTTYVRAYNGKSMAAADFVISSDQRLKAAIRPLEYRGRLNPVNFVWRKDGSADFGFIAQEVEKLYPEAVDEIKNEDEVGPPMIRQLSYQKLTAVLSYQVNRLEDKVEQLEKDKQTLTARLDAFQQRLEEEQMFNAYLSH